MGLAAYDIVGRDGAWHIEHDGVSRNTYQTKEAASRPQSRPRPLRCGRATLCA
ncbi:hypothetical protein ABMB68_007909 [Bradyrhizobium sp. RT4a]